MSTLNNMSRKDRRQVKASHLTGTYPFIEVFAFSPLDGMPVHRRVIPCIDSGPVKRGTARVKCLAQDLFHQSTTNRGGRGGEGSGEGGVKNR